MWQDIIVYAIVAVVAGLVAWQFYRKFTGKSSCCGGCASKDSCGGGGTGAGERPLRPLNHSGCGCGQ